MKVSLTYRRMEFGVPTKDAIVVDVEGANRLIVEDLMNGVRGAMIKFKGWEET
jgi:hypothetical protein